MKILVEPSEYALLNAGDVAMVTTALRRLRSLWPDARIRVLTDTPDLLPSDCDVSPMSPTGRWAWTSGGFFPWASRFVTIPASLTEWERATRLMGRSVAESAVRARLRFRGIDPRQLDDFLEAVHEADLIVVCGMGGITDYFERYTSGLLESIRLGKQNGRSVVAMFSQGIGPLRNQGLRKQASEVLRKVDFLGLREGAASCALLAELGVDQGRVVVTGDDAIEMARQYAPPQRGDRVGINVRRSTYSHVDQKMAHRIALQVSTVAGDLKAPVVPLPMSSHAVEDDAATFTVMEGVEQPGHDLRGQEHLADTLRRVQSCRVVVSGSYHAAVFALSQGIPTVCLTNSTYYDDKFIGLAQQFGVGADIVRLGSPSWEQELACAMHHAWNASEEVRHAMLAAADSQIEAGRRAYQRVFDLVEARMNTARQVSGGSR